jgi:tetratricopeptide (TPR) repeat protein
MRPSPPINVVHRLAHAEDFQPTKSSQALLAWWKQSRGVCCLVGLGGSGKTATVDHFLRRLGVLPGLAAAEDSGTQSPAVPAPAAVFVFSLSEGTPDTLFSELYAWAHGDASPTSAVKYDMVRHELATLGQSVAKQRVLLVLDGMEITQSREDAEGIGRLTDPRLRDLITNIAYGAFPGVCLLATTRFPPTDIEVQRLPCYRKIELEAMDPDAAVALLRARGVHDDVRELRRLSEHYGYHALTLDWVGGYIHRFGSPPASLSAVTGEEFGGRQGVALDLERTHIALEQVVASYLSTDGAGSAPPFTSAPLRWLSILLRRLKKILARPETSARDLVRLLSVFQRGASVTTLAGLIHRVTNSEDQHLDVPAEPAALAAALNRFADLRIVRRLGRPGFDDSYSLHEMIRNFVYEHIEPSVRRTWHSAVAVMVTETMPSAVETGGASDLTTLDLLEEAIYHEVRGPTPIEGFLRYWQHMGNYETLGHHASDYTRGERICRTLNLGRSPSDLADYFSADDRGAGVALLADWGLYLMNLGELTRAKRVFEASYWLAQARQVHVNLPIAARNLADAHLRTGDLSRALAWTERGKQDALALLQHFEGVPTQEVVRGLSENMQTTAVALAFSGDSVGAKAKLDEIVAFHRDASEAHRTLAQLLLVYPAVPRGDIQIESFAHGTPWSRYLLLGGDPEAARQNAERRLEIFVRAYGEEETSIELREILARALLELGRADDAAAQANAVYTWASKHDSSVGLCIAHSLRAGVALAHGDGNAAHAAATEGVRAARELGLSLLHIDLLAQLAEALLLLGDEQASLHAASTALYGQRPLDAGVALYEAPAREEDELDVESTDEGDHPAGIFPAPDTGLPPLLAATHPRCPYRWGEAAARRLRGEALLFSLAVESGRASATPGEVTAEGRMRLERGRGELQRSLQIFESLLIPDIRSGNVRILQLHQRLQDLESGILTSYPIHAETLTSKALAEGAHDPALGEVRLLISYSHRDAEFAMRLAADLEAALGHVWIDQRRVHVGESFVTAINQALARVTDFILVYSTHASRSMWVQNELSAAIIRRNQGKVLRIRPIRLDNSELPPLISDVEALNVDEKTYEQLVEELVLSIRPRQE